MIFNQRQEHLKVAEMIMNRHVYFTHVFILYIQGRHEKSAQEEFLSHTIENVVINFLFLILHKNSNISQSVTEAEVASSIILI